MIISSKTWAIALFIQALTVATGIILLGAAFFDVSLFHAPVINLLLWTGLISLAGLATSLTKPLSVWRQLARLLLIFAILWFPVSLLIFGNARFSGTSYFLWQLWLAYTGLLLLLPLTSLAASAVGRLWVRRRA
jgi:hypothetical protein